MNTFDEQLQNRQNELLKTAQAFFGEEKIDTRLVEAFLQMPRHLFVHRFESSLDGHWIERNEENTERHLPLLYQDQPICIFRNENGEVVSTISQPSLVLYMIQLLDLKSGMTVFELGGGSGWHAALMSHLVGPTGKVFSVEIIAELAQQAKAMQTQFGLDNIEFIHGDGSEGLVRAGPFDRGVFTASTRELPSVFFSQIKVGGLLEFVMKLSSGEDLLCLLRKKDECFVSEYLMPCNFVPVTGERYAMPVPIVVLESLPKWEDWNALSPDATLTEELGVAKEDMAAFIDVCQVVCCQFHHFDSVENTSLRSNEFLCGILPPEKDSLVLLTDDRLLSYGNRDSLDLLYQIASAWLAAGKPEVDQLDLSIYPIDSCLPSSEGNWVVQGKECAYCWSMPVGK